MQNVIFIKIWTAGALSSSGFSLFKLTRHILCFRAKKGHCRKKRFKLSSLVIAPFTLFDSQIYRNNICIHAGCLLVMSIT